MDETLPEVKEVLAAIAHKLMASSLPLSGLDVGMALYGLRAMVDRNSAEITIILGTVLVYDIIC